MASASARPVTPPAKPSASTFRTTSSTAAHAGAFVLSAGRASKVFVSARPIAMRVRPTASISELIGITAARAGALVARATLVSTGSVVARSCAAAYASGRPPWTTAACTARERVLAGHPASRANVSAAADGIRSATGDVWTQTATRAIARSAATRASRDWPAETAAVIALLDQLTATFRKGADSSRINAPSSSVSTPRLRPAIAGGAIGRAAPGKHARKGRACARRRGR